MVVLEIGILDTGGTGGLETGKMVLEIGMVLERGMVVLETGMVVRETGVPDTAGTGVLDNGMVVLETGVVVLEVGVPDTGGTGGLERGPVGAERAGTRAERVHCGGEQELSRWMVAVAGVGGETWISRM
jgi:hypothetical protein